MKKAILAIAIILGAFGVKADVVTNWVYVVSNVYTQVFTENVITQKVKNTHYNYYYTNYVSIVTNVYETTWRTNTTVMCDVSAEYVNAASNYSASAAASSTSAGGYASDAQGYAQNAQNAYSWTSAAAANGLNQINARIAWFEEHSGETITMLTSNVIVNVNAQDYSFTYTNAAGVAFNYVTVHPFGANGGATVAPRSSSAYSTVAIRAWPRPRVSGYWDFYPAYIDSDENGMRLQYLPDTTTPIPYQDANGAYPTGKIVPEYFYWQSGYIYFKVRVWVDGEVVAWCLTRYQWSNWPTTIGYGGDSGTAMELVSRQSYGDTAMGTTLAFFYSRTRTAAANTAIEFPMEPSAAYAPTLEWMRNGPVVSDLQDQVAALSAEWSSVRQEWEQMRSLTNDWASFREEVSSSLADMSNTLANAVNGYPHDYVSPGGTTYTNMVYYDRATDDGKVAITTIGNYYPSLEYRFIPNYGGNTSGRYWTFEPAYIDTDVYGMRLHYLPKSTNTVTATTYNAGNKYVPRDFYWQDGTIYVVIDSYNGTTWSGRVRAKFAGTGENAYPNALLYTASGSSISTSNYKYMQCDSIEGSIMGNGSNFNPGYLKTVKVMSAYNSVLWFPETPTIGQQAIVSWLATWTR